MSSRARGRRGRPRAGYTLVELLVYLSLFIFLTGTLVASDLFARRLARSQGALFDGLGDADRFFSGLAGDCDRASGVAAEGSALRLEGAADYRFEAAAGTIARNGKAVLSGVRSVRFEPGARPGLFRVTLDLRRGEGADGFERTFRRTYFLAGAQREKEKSLAPF